MKKRTIVLGTLALGLSAWKVFIVLETLVLLLMFSLAFLVVLFVLVVLYFVVVAEEQFEEVVRASLIYIKESYRRWFEYLARIKRLAQK